jgi:hypothetical protein
MLASVVTQWLIPFLLVAVASVFAYLGGWVVKRQDVERTIAFDVDELLEQAQQAAADRDAWSEETLRQTRHLTQTAGMRARRLGDDDINDRFKTCGLFLMDATLAFRDNQRYWAGEAIANIRVGLDAFTAPPSLLPWRKPTNDRQRLFPTNADYAQLMQYDDHQVPDVLVLAQWQTAHGVR